MEQPQTAPALLEIEQRQDEVLRGLDSLNEQLENLLARYQRNLRVVQATTDAAS